MRRVPSISIVLLAAIHAASTVAFVVTSPMRTSLLASKSWKTSSSSQSQLLHRTIQSSLTRTTPLVQLSASSSDNDDNTDDDSKSLAVHVDPLVRDTSLLMRRLSWCSWWAQLSLTIVSSVTLLFARNVIQGASVIKTTVGTNFSLPNFVLAGSGIVLSLGSIFWTWATRRLARRLLKRPTSKIQAANMVRKAITVGVTLNLLGMFCTIVGAEQIVGSLAIKVLTTASYRATLLEAGSPGGLLQPLDILIVQANTNTLFSHFCGLVSLLYLTRKVGQLDPPSQDGKERPRTISSNR